MAKFGSLDFKELQDFAKIIESMENEKSQEFYEKLAKELTARLLAKVIPLTPVRDSNSATGVKGGTMRRGWTAQTEAEAERDPKEDISAGEIRQYVNGLEIEKNGSMYTVKIINPVHYTLFREYGHRTVNGAGQGWVEGSFMLTISEEELKGETPRIIQRKLNKFLKENLT